MKKYSSQQKKVREYTKNAILTMLKWAKEEYQLSNLICDPKIIISFDKKRQYSYGGWHLKRPYVNLALDKCVNFKREFNAEYDWFNKDAEIGGKWITTWKQYVRMIVAHEVAHCIEYSRVNLYDKNQKERLNRIFGRDSITEDHSETFQKIYRVLRRKFVNKIWSKKHGI